MNSYKLNIRISEEMFLQFSKSALKSGETKSSILRSEINRSSASNLLYSVYKPKQAKNTNFMFELTETELNKLSNLALNLGLSKSEVICRIIYNFTNKINSQAKSELEIQKLYNEGRLAEIAVLFSKPSNEYSIDELLVLFQTYIYLGYIVKAKEVEFYLNSIAHSLSLDQKIHYLTLNAHLQIFINKPHSLKMIDLLIKKIIPSQSTYKYLARLFSLKASLISYSNVKQDNFLNHSKALMYLNPVEESVRAAEVFMLLSLESSENCEVEKNRMFLKDTEDIIESSDNIFYKGWFLNEKAMSLAALGETSRAEETILESIRCHRKSGSIIKEYYSHTILCKILFAEKRYDDAFLILQKADGIGEQLGFNSPYSFFQFTKLNLLSVKNFSESKSKFDNLLSQVETNDTVKYAYASMLFMNNQDAECAEQGRRLLKNLKDNALNISVKQAAKKTLLDKKFYYAR